MRTAYLALVALVAAFCAMMALRAEAHEFYSYGCCHERDCRPLPDASVKEGPTGYIVTIPGRKEAVLIPYGDYRIKIVPAQYDDGLTFHVCTTSGEAETLVLCLYTPGRGT